MPAARMTNVVGIVLSGWSVHPDERDAKMSSKRSFGPPMVLEFQSVVEWRFLVNMVTNNLADCCKAG